MTGRTTDMVEVLLVEDMPEDAELTIRTLKKYSMANNLMWVKDGIEALDFLFGTGAHAGRAKQNVPRVILLDLHLPKLDGLEVLRRLKSDPVTQLIPVVVLTSSTQESDIRECYGLGVNSFVSKPVEFDAFMKVVGKLGFYWLLVNRMPGQ